MYDNEYNTLLTLEDLCEYLMIGKNAAYQLLNSNEIKAFKIGRVWKIPKEAVQEYVLTKSGLE